MEIRLNNEFNGIEVLFESKPERAVIDELKNAGFRWHNVKKIWYAKNTAERLALAESLADGQQIPAPVAISKTSEVVNLDNLGVKPSNFSYYGADLAKLIREDLKKRGVKGVTVRSRMSGYTTSITVTVKAAPADFVSIEEGAQRFNTFAFSCDLGRGLYTNGRYLYFPEWEAMTDEEKTAAHLNYITESINKINSVQFGYSWASRAHYWEFAADFWDKLTAIYKIANQWNYCNDDIMTDYFDRGYYLDIDLKKADDFAPRQEMTDAERKAYAEEQEEKEAKEEAERKAFEAEQKAREEASAKYDAWRAGVETAIYNDITVEDIPEENQLYITGLAGGIGKESTLDELRETISERIAEPEEAAITRKVIFNTESVFDDFCKLFLDDFTFLAGKGGTASDDIRLKDFEMYNRLTPEQRESIKFYNSDCIAVYVGAALRLVINPQGYSYARYVYIPTETTEIRNATEESAKQTAESEEKPAFYIPAPIEEQSEAIRKGQQITIYQCDGWILNNIYAGSGTVEAVTPGNYAQYTGIYIHLRDGRKERRVFIRNGKECLIYEGIKEPLPDEVTGEVIKTGTGYTMREMYNYDKLLPNTYNYYLSQGITPILDTCPR